MPETNTAIDNGDPVEVTFESALAEISALNDSLEVADEALQELQEHAEDVQSVVRSAPLRVLIRRLVEVRAILDSMRDGVNEATSSVEALGEVYGEEDEPDGGDKGPGIAHVLALLSASDAMTAATAFCEGDQNWNEGETRWTFQDGSVLVVCGTEVRAEEEESEARS